MLLVLASRGDPGSRVVRAAAKPRRPGVRRSLRRRRRRSGSPSADAAVRQGWPRLSEPLDAFGSTICSDRWPSPAPSVPTAHGYRRTDRARHASSMNDTATCTARSPAAVLARSAAFDRTGPTSSLCRAGAWRVTPTTTVPRAQPDPAPQLGPGGDAAVESRRRRAIQRLLWLPSRAQRAATLRGADVRARPRSSTTCRCDHVPPRHLPQPQPEPLPCPALRNPRSSRRYSSGSYDVHPAEPAMTISRKPIIFNDAVAWLRTAFADPVDRQTSR